MSLGELSKKIIDLINKGHKIYKLHIGEVNPRPFDKIINSTLTVIQNDSIGYTDCQGLYQLRQKICKDYLLRKNVLITPDNIILTNGSKQGIFYSINYLLNKGDEVILPKPCWSSYEKLILLSHGVVKYIDIDSNGNIQINKLINSITPKTKLIILCNPHNPTGTIISKDNLDNLVKIISKYNLWVLSDEIYERIDYDKKHISLLEYPLIRDKLLLTNGFSKSHCMTGYRLGYLIANSKVIRDITKLQSHICTCPNTIAQKTALAFMDNRIEINNLISGMVADLKVRRKILVELFSKLEIPFWKPDGAFYFFVDITKLLKSNENDINFTDYLLKNNIAVVPGSYFGLGNHIRISYGCDQNDFNKAIEIFNKILISL